MRIIISNSNFNALARVGRYHISLAPRLEASRIEIAELERQEHTDCEVADDTECQEIVFWTLIWPSLSEDADHDVPKKAE